MTKKKVEVEKPIEVKGKTLLIQMGDEEYKVTIPPGSRVTFGPTIPYQKKSERGYSTTSHDGYSLRVYENSKNDSLIAVFAGVSSFRDISMPHAKLIVRESGKSVWKSDEDGYHVEHEVKKEKSFDALKALEP